MGTILCITALTSGSNCIYIPCADNFVLLLSDGEWNEPSSEISSSATGTIITTDADPVVPAYVMHHDFLNTQTSRTPGSGKYTPSRSSKGPQQRRPQAMLALKNVAMYGSYPTTTAYPAGTAGLPQTTCGSSSGSLYSLFGVRLSWILTAMAIPDTWSGGDTASEIKSSIYAAIQDILSHTTAGTAASVLASREGSGANLLQAVYYPKKLLSNATVDWWAISRTCGIISTPLSRTARSARTDATARRTTTS